MIMELKVLLFLWSSITSFGLGTAAALKRNPMDPSGLIPFYIPSTEITYNIPEVQLPDDVEPQTMKEVNVGSLSNGETASISQDKSVINKKQEINKSSSFDKGHTSILSTTSSSSKMKDEIQPSMQLKADIGLNNETKQKLNQTKTESDYEHADKKRENLNLGGVKILLLKLSEESDGKCNQSESNGSLILNENNYHPNNSNTEGDECCEGKGTGNMYNYVKQHKNNHENLELNINNGRLRSVTEQKKFEEIKKLILGHLESMNIKQYLESENGNVSKKEAIKSSRNVFELIGTLNKIFRTPLEVNEENRENPSNFVKTLVNEIIKKCDEKHKDINMDMTFTEIGKNNRTMNFIKCVNRNLKTCVRIFGEWLRMNNFNLMPDFNLSNAYKIYNSKNLCPSFC